MTTKKKAATKKKKAATKQKRAVPKIEQMHLENWLDTIKKSHETALAAAATPSGCCQVQNQQTGGVFQIPTDAATCQSIGGVFIPGPC
jgi:hypothetical protein